MFIEYLPINKLFKLREPMVINVWLYFKGNLGSTGLMI